MQIVSLTASALLAAAAFAPTSASAQGQPEPYRATGTEPFWSLTIDARTMRFEAPGHRPVIVGAPRPIIGFAGEIYRTPRINANITHIRCSDGMSDRAYRDTVQLTVDGRSYRGCGGEAIDVTPARPNAPLLGEWRALSIVGRPPVGSAEVTVNFRDGRISGNTGCNAFGGPYSVRRGILTAGPMISTRRACTIPTNAQEQNLLGMLGERLIVSLRPNGRLVLTARDGRTLMFAPMR